MRMDQTAATGMTLSRRPFGWMHQIPSLSMSVFFSLTTIMVLLHYGRGVAAWIVPSFAQGTAPQRQPSLDISRLGVGRLTTPMPIVIKPNIASVSRRTAVLLHGVGGVAAGVGAGVGAAPTSWRRIASGGRHAPHPAHRTILAGKIWPALSKLGMMRVLWRDIVFSVVDMTHWQDLVALSFMVFGIVPLARWSTTWNLRQRFQQHWNRRRRVRTATQRARAVVDLAAAEEIPTITNDSESNMAGFGSDTQPITEQEQEEEQMMTAIAFEQRKRFATARLIREAGWIAFSVYAVDVLCVALSVVGFHFPHTWSVPSVYTKSVYTAWALQRFLLYKRMALCQIFKVDTESMGRVEILDRFLGGVAVGLICLLLFDWLSVRMGLALKGLVAFGSVGTLAFTLASQGLVSQFLSGIFLTASNKLYVGDSVQFGDGTAGKVIKLGWMETMIRGGDNTVTAVPNAVLAGQKISNLSRLKQSQVRQTLRFHYDDAEHVPAILEAIKAEIRKSCPRLITDGSRPFRAFWTSYNEDHLEVMVDTHFSIAPLGDAYWKSRQQVLQAIHRAVRNNGIRFAEMYRVVPGREPEWRVIPRFDANSLDWQQQADLTNNRRRSDQDEPTRRGIIEEIDDPKGPKAYPPNGEDATRR